MHGFTMALAQEVASKGVTVNTVSPGYIAADLVRAIRREVLDKIITNIPVKRLGTPQDIASIVSWVGRTNPGSRRALTSRSTAAYTWGEPSRCGGRADCSPC